MVNNMLSSQRPQCCCDGNSDVRHRETNCKCSEWHRMCYPHPPPLFSCISKCEPDCVWQIWSSESGWPRPPFTRPPLQPAPPLLHPRHPQPSAAAQPLALQAAPLSPPVVRMCIYMNTLENTQTPNDREEITLINSNQGNQFYHSAKMLGRLEKLF